MNCCSHLACNLERAPRIASPSTMWTFWHHCSHYSIALNLIVTAYTLLSPTSPNCLSSLQQMEPSPSQVRNHYSQNNPEAHVERALAFKKAANVHRPSNVWLSIISLAASYCGWLMSRISVIKQVHHTYQEISDGKSEDCGDWTVSSDIEEDNWVQQQEVQKLC